MASWTMAMGMCLASCLGSTSPGTIRGVVKWNAAKNPQGKLLHWNNPECHRIRRGMPPLRSESLVVTDGRVKSVFVYIKEGLQPDVKWPVPETPVVLDQVGCQFRPHVLGAMVGQQVLITNNDDTAHNVSARPANSNGFSIGQPAKGASSKRSFTAPEIMVPIGCDVHPWMRAYVGVLDHPFFAVTDEKGEFVIENVPPGRYVLSTWVEDQRLDARTVEIDVRSDHETAVEFTYPE